MSYIIPVLARVCETQRQWRTGLDPGMQAGGEHGWGSVGGGGGEMGERSRGLSMWDMEMRTLKHPHPGTQLTKELGRGRNRQPEKQAVRGTDDQTTSSEHWVSSHNMLYMCMKNSLT